MVDLGWSTSYFLGSDAPEEGACRGFKHPEDALQELHLTGTLLQRVVDLLFLANSQWEIKGFWRKIAVAWTNGK